MSGAVDPRNNRLQAMYLRWNQLRMQLGSAANQNEEFISLSHTLQQASRQANQSRQMSQAALDAKHKDALNQPLKRGVSPGPQSGPQPGHIASPSLERQPSLSSGQMPPSGGYPRVQTPSNLGQQLPQPQRRNIAMQQLGMNQVAPMQYPDQFPQRFERYPTQVPPGPINEPPRSLSRASNVSASRNPGLEGDAWMSLEDQDANDADLFGTGMDGFMDMLDEPGMPVQNGSIPIQAQHSIPSHQQPPQAQAQTMSPVTQRSPPAPKKKITTDAELTFSSPLIDPVELGLLGSQEFALRAIQSGQQIPDAILDSLFENPNAIRSLPTLNLTIPDANTATEKHRSEINQQQMLQQKLDQELNLKRAKRQQWEEDQNKQPQNDADPSSNNVAFVVPNGSEMSTRSRLIPPSPLVKTESPAHPADMFASLGFNKSVDPQSLIPESEQFANFGSHDEILMVPSLLPSGVSAQEMHHERAVRHRIQLARRRVELSNRPRTMDEEIELMQIRLSPYLRAVRGDLLTMIQYFDGVAVNKRNRLLFARMKFLTQHDAAIVERFVNEQALERRKNENVGQHARLERVIAQRKDFAEMKEIKNTKRKALKASITHAHEAIERDERRRYERNAKERLQLLRANDEEAYLRLIDQTKDARITHLLRQTNKFLSGLALAVKNQQGENAAKEENKTPETEIEEAKNGQTDEEDLREKVDYYEVAHRIKEPVTEQPSILVGGKLKEYQLKGLQWLISLYNNKLNGILADEMGLGKTIQSIALITYLIEVKKIQGPFLVLVPLSTLTNWNSEFDTWAPSVKKVVYRGPPTTRKLYQNQIKNVDFQVLLTTYEYVIKERSLFSKIKWEHMIIDEGHRMKNTQSKLSSTLAQYYHSKYRLILTGTPLQNNLPELWALLNFVLPKIFNSVKSFEEWFNTPFLQAGTSDRMDLGEEEKLLIIRRLHKVLRPFLLRRLKKDVEQDLPDKIERVVQCKMSSLQKYLYRQLLGYNNSVLGQQGGIRTLSNRVMQLRKLCNHPFVFEEVEKIVNPSAQNNDLLWRTSGKFELLDRILPKMKAAGHRTLLFFQMTQIMDIMEDFLRLRGIQYLRLDGMTKAESRSDLLRKFNDPDSPYFCFLLSTRAGGLGINLQTADTVIIYDTDWNPHQDLQAQDRAHRIGQTKEVLILRLITENSIEKHILDRAQGKLDIDGKVIQAGKFDNKSTAEEQEAFLRTLLIAEETKQQPVEEQEPKTIDDEDINSMIARSEEERELFQRMDDEREAVEKGPRLYTDEELPEQYTISPEKLLAHDADAEQTMPSRRKRTHDEVQPLSSGDDMDGFAPPAPIVPQPPTPAPRKKRETAPDTPQMSERAVETFKQQLTTSINESGELLPHPPVQTIMQYLPKPRLGKKGRPPRIKELLTLSEREMFSSVCRQLIRILKSNTDNSGRLRIELFLELPSRSLYPDYYQVIALPVCVSSISKRLEAKYYQSFEQFANDWRLIFRNARWYNAKGSVIYNDADELERSFEEHYSKLIGVKPPPYIDVLGNQPEKLRTTDEPPSAVALVAQEHPEFHHPNQTVGMKLPVQPSLPTDELLPEGNEADEMMDHQGFSETPQPQDEHHDFGL